MMASKELLYALCRRILFIKKNKFKELIIHKGRIRSHSHIFEKSSLQRSYSMHYVDTSYIIDIKQNSLRY